MNPSAAKSTNKRVAFCNIFSSQWMGGVVYLRNLFLAIRAANVSGAHSQKISPIIFCSPDTEPGVLKILSPLVDEVVVHRRFKQNSFLWIVDEVFYLLFRFYPILNFIMKTHGIDVVSHAKFAGKNFPFKTVTWIPDFQHYYYPELFNKRELSSLNRNFHRMANHSDRLILSSQTALGDLKRFVQVESTEQVKILNFVSPFETMQFSDDISKKFNLPEKYFYVPNQFWKHKNHRAVLEAVYHLNQSGKRVWVIFSGHMDDYRNHGYVSELLDFVSQHGLQDQIRFLGKIDYREVTYLFIHSLAIINPSLFEGWSTTVEESKTLNKRILLSDLKVHFEQNPAFGVFFKVNDPRDLAEKMWACWQDPIAYPARIDSESLEKRMREYGDRYKNVILELFDAN